MYLCDHSAIVKVVVASAASVSWKHQPDLADNDQAIVAPNVKNEGECVLRDNMQYDLHKHTHSGCSFSGNLRTCCIFGFCIVWTLYKYKPGRQHGHAIATGLAERRWHTLYPVCPWFESGTCHTQKRRRTEQWSESAYSRRTMKRRLLLYI